MSGTHYPLLVERDRPRPVQPVQISQSWRQGLRQIALAFQTSSSGSRENTMTMLHVANSMDSVLQIPEDPM